jgi:hypothetical protein
LIYSLRIINDALRFDKDLQMNVVGERWTVDGELMRPGVGRGG